MILGLGFDLVEIERVRNSLCNPRFALRVFAESENLYFATLAEPVQSMAANFAAKEAFGKALGTGISGFVLSETAILRNAQGAPYFEFYGRASDIIREKGCEVSVSLTHTKTTAGAVVLLCKPN